MLWQLGLPSFPRSHRSAWERTGRPLRATKSGNNYRTPNHSANRSRRNLAASSHFSAACFEIDLHRPDRPRGLDRRLDGHVRVQRHLGTGALGQPGLDLRRKDVIDQAAGFGRVRRSL